jgi:integrase
MKLPNPKITQDRYSSGTPYWLVSCTLRGQRYRKKHSNEEAANHDKARLFRAAAANLSAHEYLAAEQAIYLLKGTSNLDARGRDVIFAVQWFCEHYVNPAKIKTVRAYFNEFMSIKSAQGRRAATIEELDRFLERFVQAFEDSDVTLLRYPDLETWIKENSNGPSSRKRVTQILKHFFGYLSGQSKKTPNPHPILKESPFKGREVVFQDDDSGDETQIVIFTARECEDLIRQAQLYNAQRMFIWLLFTGMRPVESVRFWTDPRWGWNLISDDLKFIRVPKAVSKTRRSRVIEVSPTLRLWLKAYRHFPSFMTRNWGGKYRQTRKKVLPKEKLKQDIARHTLISMMIKDGKGWAEIELQMGNKKDVQMRHYASLIASRNEVDDFYGLTPDRFEHDIDEETYRAVVQLRRAKSPKLQAGMCRKSEHT